MTIRGPLAVTLLVVLFLSLAANLMIAGFTVARIAGGPRPGGDIERIVAIGIRAFPEEVRRVIEQRARQDRDEFRERYEALREARQGMFEAMRSDPFDRTVLDAAFAEVRSRTNELQAVGQNLVAEALGEASPETRHRIMMQHGPFP